MVDKGGEMVMDEQERLGTVERRTAELEQRLALVERAVAMAVPARPAPPQRATVRAKPPAPAVEAEAPANPALTDGTLALPSFEDLLGGRVLAWFGGAAVLVGLAFFFAMAISRGWLGQEARCAIGAVAGLALVALGVRAQAAGRTPEAALTAIGAGVAALDVDIAVATQGYDLFSPAAGVALALAVGAAATILALRRSSPTIAAFGILGGLLAPALAGADYHGGTVALLLAASVPAAAVLVARRWDAIAIGAFVVTAVQLGLWLVDGPSTAATLLALSAFGALWVAQAIGFELRTAAPRIRPASAFLLTLDALVLAGLGSALLLGHGDATVAHIWLAGLAVAHLAVGLATDRLPRVSHELRLLALSLGVVLTDVAVAAALDGVAVPLAYAGGAVAFAGLRRALPRRQADHPFLLAGLGGHVLLTAAHAIVVDAPPTALTSDAGAGAGALVLAALAAASFAAARLTDGAPRPLRAGLDAVALGAVAWLGALTLDPVPLALAWAAQGVALAQVWRRTGDGVAATAAWAHLAGGAAVALATVAPPAALTAGLDDPAGAALALGALTVALARAARLGVPLPGVFEHEQSAATRLLTGAAALVALHLVSSLVVTPLAPHPGQVALSALWGLLGAGTLVVGLARDRVGLRRGGLALLLVTVGKVFLADLATLDSAARAGSFLAVGILLLAAAFAWQRQRPQAGLPEPAVR
jgi:uncharacterized membrane protein